MDKRITPFLFSALWRMLEAPSSKVGRGTHQRAKIRDFRFCGVLAVKRAVLALQPAAPISTPSRTFIHLVAPISTRRMEYSESRTVRYTPQQIFNVVASVDQYQHFVPWCKKSRVIKGHNGDVQAELEMGFPPFVERYTSRLTFIPNHQVRAVGADGSLFSHLETIWNFTPAAEDQPGSCQVDFYMSFEFKSLLHTQLSQVFFDEVLKQMVRAFESRLEALHSSQQVAEKRMQRASDS